MRLLARDPDGGLRESRDTLAWLRIGDLRASGREFAVLLARPSRGLWLPGCIGGADIQHLGARVAVAEAEGGLPDGSTRFLAGASDSPAGVLALDRLSGASPRLAGLVWDEAALAAALGPEPDHDVLRHARSRTILAAAACGVPVYRVVDSEAAVGQEV